ncbi:MAG TPA: sugar transferase [Steroidobacteraceae bacterium]|nr:sugar transferase [Steroidobacteraceae bacterium]
MLKRVFDLLVAIIAAVATAPIMGIVALVVRCSLGRPVLFRQWRPGRNGREFQLLKFRTMIEACDERGRPLPDHERLTGFGKLLRRTSLDELPELINVLKGEMSLVGPRPLLAEYLPLYTPEQSRRHEVRPGITGWAQVNGRNAISWERKFELDVWYVDHASIWLDMKILWMTVSEVLRGHGVEQPGTATAEIFRGSVR